MVTKVRRITIHFMDLFGYPNMHLTVSDDLHLNIKLKLKFTTNPGGTLVIIKITLLFYYLIITCPPQ